MVPVVLCDTRHSGLNLSAGETTFFRGFAEEKTMTTKRSGKTPAKLLRVPLQAAAIKAFAVLSASPS